MRRLRSVAGAILALVASAAGAEVRLVHLRDGSTDVVVRPATTGVWSPIAPIDARTLNPDGDLHHDGMPAIHRDQSGVIVAWHRTATGELHVVEGEAEWQLHRRLSANLAPDSPLLVARSASVTVACWRSPDGDVVVGDLVAGDQVRLPISEPLHLIAVGDAVHLLAYVPDPFPVPDLSLHDFILRKSPSGQLTLEAEVTLSSAPVEGDRATGTFVLPCRAGSTHVAWWYEADRLAVAHLDAEGLAALGAERGLQGNPEAVQRVLERRLCR